MAAVRHIEAVHIVAVAAYIAVVPAAAVQTAAETALAVALGQIVPAAVAAGTAAFDFASADCPASAAARPAQVPHTAQAYNQAKKHLKSAVRLQAVSEYSAKKALRLQPVSAVLPHLRFGLFPLKKPEIQGLNGNPKHLNWLNYLKQAPPA